MSSQYRGKLHLLLQDQKLSRGFINLAGESVGLNEWALFCKTARCESSKA